MNSLTDLREVVDVVIGVDTHVHTHSVALVDHRSVADSNPQIAADPDDDTGTRRQTLRAAGAGGGVCACVASSSCNVPTYDTLRSFSARKPGGGCVAWKYERDESPRRKHQGTSDKPEFIQQGDEIVGKCPKTITVEQAEAALNSGFGYNSERNNPGYPSRIYSVIDGVVYRAMPTNPGVSYHGFPEMPENFKPYSKLAGEILRLAVADGSEEEVKNWLKQCRKA